MKIHRIISVLDTLQSDAESSLGQEKDSMSNESPFSPGLMIALATGLIIGIQAIFIGIAGQAIGPLRASVVIQLSGTLFGAALVLIFAQSHTGDGSILNPRTLIAAAIAGSSGMLILSGIAYSFPQIGQVAGQTTLILGQMVVAIIVDVSGISTGQPIPLDVRRIAGLVVLAVALVLLLPRTEN
jgi:uncharacterized membrane protein YdcZ (DUF606 family)